ncbi:hypothetical protein [Bombilactobacillus bombi]|uniref:hypothetical protein n=1 Tax=Bombilactobacillus bombi TaxID=1303590 RepID=UPI0015E5CF8B|nr:hypothetical protein [Bombilactobacillus bombi]MBA1435201.1 hypothetical protein [Bombilactobacillus bombi]
MIELIVSGIQLFVLQIFNLISGWKLFNKHQRIITIVIMPLLAVFGAYSCKESTVLSGLIFTFLLVGINYRFFKAKSIRIFYPFFGLLLSLIIFLIINALKVRLQDSFFNIQFLHILAFLLGNGLAAFFQKLLLLHFADIILQEHVQHLIIGGYVAIIIILGSSTIFLGDDLNNVGVEIELIMILLLTMLLLLVYFLETVQKIRHMNAIQQIQQIEDYAQVLEHSYHELSQFKHDYLNVLASSLLFLKNKNFQGLEQYYQETIKLIDTSFTYDNLRINDLQNINLIPLKGLLSYKLISAYQNKIPVHFECLKPVQINFNSPISLIAIIEAIIDQAFQYAGDHQTQVEILITSEKNYVSLVVSISLNSVDQDSSKVNELFQQILASRSEYNQQPLKEILAMEDKFELINAVKNGHLVQELIINEE